MKRFGYISIAFSVILAGMVSISCEPDPIPVTQREFKNVAILYSVGRNTLSDYLLQDIDEFASGDIPAADDDNAVIVVGHHYINTYDPVEDKYNSKSYIYDSSPVVVRLYKNPKTNVTTKDTVKVFPKYSDSGYPNLLTDPDFMNEILTYVKDNFKSEKYGMVYSSHGFGWLPQGYYSDPSSFEGKVSNLPGRNRTGVVLPAGAHEYVERETDTELPLTKSVGEEVFFYKGTRYALEMDIREMRRAIPMHMDYMIFDACLMGGIEVAYELKDVTDFLVLSPAEVLAYGFNYKTMAASLFGNDGLHAHMVAKDYYDYYKDRTGSSQSATITFIRTAELENLANVCRTLFEKYRSRINALDPSKVQSYSQADKGKHWFYDLEFMLLRAGMTEEEQIILEKALKLAAPYRAATDMILGKIVVRIYSGFSMYLPSNGSEYLNNYYRSLAWNEATGLVE